MKITSDRKRFNLFRTANISLHRNMAKTCFSICLAGFSLGGMLVPVHANSTDSNKFQGYTVDTVVDNGDLNACTSAPDDCSLRGAVNKSNHLPGTDFIYIPAGVYTLRGASEEDLNKGGDLDVLEEGGSIVFYGDGAEKTILDGDGNDRIFHLPDYGESISISVSDMTLRNGYAPTYITKITKVPSLPVHIAVQAAIKEGAGGAIKSYGSVYLNNVNFLDNSGRAGGAIFLGAAYYGSRLVMKDCFFSGNHAALDGGAVFSYGSEAEISGSTFGDNKAERRGGAIYNESSLTISTSTFFNNNSPEGGAILNYTFLGGRSTVNINNSTFSNNSTAIRNYVDGYGNNQTYGTVSISNSILANSTLGGNCENEVDKEGLAVIKDMGNNLDSGVTCKFKGQISMFGKDPMLGALQENGGPTPTMALGDGSPAINKGNPVNCTHRDQRGLAAVEVCDIGAYEYNASPVITTSVGKNRLSMDDGTVGDQLIVTVTNAFGNPLKGWHIYFSNPDGASMIMRDTDGFTDEYGQVSTIVLSKDLTGASHPITVSAGGAEVGFIVNSQSSMAVSDFGKLFLPATGFAPGKTSLVERQPKEESYNSITDMELVIPSLKVDAPLVGVPQNEKGWNLDWLANDAGYLEGTAFPTWAGNSVITGHVFNSDGKPGIFTNLKYLEEGDKVVIRAWGQDYVYLVRSMEVVSPGTNRILKHEDKSWITLITCQDFDPVQNIYLRRLVIRASFAGIQ